MARDADVLVVGGRIFRATRQRPWAKALAMRGDRLLAVGTEAQAARWEGRRTRRLDLRGRVILPGFIDAHSHIADAAAERGWTDLAGTRRLEDALERLRRAAGRTPRSAWILGRDWDEAKWVERRYPTREDLDRVSIEHRVVARRIDCHMAAANSLALEGTEDLVGLRGFETDAMGRATGILKEDAFAAFQRRFEPTPQTIETGLPAVARMAHALGITSIHDIVDADQMRAYQRAHGAGRLRLRVYAMPRDSLLPHLVAAGLATGLGDAWLRLGAVKVFADGSLGAYTAALSRPYEGRPGDMGLLVHTNEELRATLSLAHRSGFQTATHAIGDAAIRQVLDVLEAVLQDDPRRDHRHRIEHFELPDDGMLARTRAAGLVASCQPNFVGQWSGPGDVYETRLGMARAARNNPYREIRRRRIPLCFGSDGMPYGPLYGIHSAVHGFFEDQRVPVEEAIRAYTAGSAYASFEEHLKGTLEPGKLADFVVLEDDSFEAPDRIRQARIHSTWIGGECVYRRRSKS